MSGVVTEGICQQKVILNIAPTTLLSRKQVLLSVTIISTVVHGTASE